MMTKGKRIAELELWKKNAVERMKGLGDGIEKRDKRILELELWIEYAVAHSPTIPEWIQNSASCLLRNTIKGGTNEIINKNTNRSNEDTFG